MHLLNKALNDLKSAGYHGSLADQGNAHYEERSGTGFLPKLNMALNQLSSVVAKVLPNLINITLNRESKRIIGAISFMVEVITKRLHEQALSVIDGRLPLSPPQLQELNHDLKPITAHFQMSGGFSTSSQSRNEKVGTSYEKVGEKRTWYTLFIGKKDVYDYVDKYEQRSYDNASIPSIYDVADGWVHQIEGALSEYSREIQKRVETKLNESYANVVTSQQQSFSEFKQRLEEASHELDQTFRDNISPWEDLKAQHSNLQERVRAFTVRS
jgi:FtsZ-binding cell division protein ZapB